MRVLVTGATGFIGRHVIDLLLERGHSVRGLVFEPALAPALAGRGVEVVLGDVTRPATLVAACRGMEGVVHAAACVRGAPRHQHLRVTAGGTAHVLAAARAAGVARFVHLSSTAVYRRPPGGGRLGEETPHLREDTPEWRRGGLLGHYSVAKALAERHVWRAGRDGFPVTVLRPVLVYSETHPVHRLLHLPVLPLPQGGRFPTFLVHVHDVAVACLLALERSAAVGQAFNISDGEQHTAAEIIAAYRALAGRAPLILPLPWLRPFTPPGTCISIDKARSLLGYEPRITLREGLLRIVRQRWPGRRSPAVASRPSVPARPAERRPPPFEDESL